jgi:hypothetical protein
MFEGSPQQAGGNDEKDVKTLVYKELADSKSHDT